MIQYDVENRPTAMLYSNGMRVRYYYDELGRLHHRNVGVESTGMIVGTEYYFQDNPNGSTTPLVTSINVHGGVYQYAYDDNGRITQINNGGSLTDYVYDTLGQLIRVNDQTGHTGGTAGTTWLFTYDLGGNILTKTAYPYSTTDTLGTAVETHTYTYGNSGWKDQLTARDGVTIQYDSIGNPTNDGIWQYNLLLLLERTA